MGAFMQYSIILLFCSVHLYQASCPYGQEYTNDGFIYCIASEGDNDQSDFWTAREYCFQDGGDLVSITSYEENQFVQSMVDDQGSIYRGFWIGLTKFESVTDEYSWVDGSPVTFTSFSNNPSNRDDDFDPKCTFMYYDSFMRWYYGNCGRRQAIICKRPEGDQLPPSTLPPPTLVAGYCPAGFFGLGNKCYKMVTAIEADPVNVGVTFEEALESCRNLTEGLFPDLASIANEEENAEVTSLLYRDDSGYWLGRSGQGWTDNSPMTYDNWDEGRQSGYTTINGHHYHAGKWRGTDGNSRRGYICQVKKDPDNIIPSPHPGPCEGCPTNCPEDYTPYWDSCYKLESIPRTWSEANAVCANAGGHLASIHGEVENDAIFMFTKDHRIEGRSSWIGLHDANNDGDYSWSDDWAVTYTRWDAMEPARLGECVAMNGTGRWITEDCSQEAPFVCKVTDQEPIKIPDTEGGICPDPKWVPILDSCYYFVTNYFTWDSARLHCAQRHPNSYMAYIHSALENRLVAEAMRKAMGGSTSPDFWIGLYIPRGQNEFAWYNRTEDPVEYVNWYPGEKAQDYDSAYMSNDLGSHRFGRWITTYGSLNNKFLICKTATVPTSTLPPPHEGHCPDENWLPYGQECLYFANDVSLPWDSAKAECKRLGGNDANLATILDVHKNRFIHENMHIDPANSFWIGLRTSAENAPWYWDATKQELEAVGYENWALNQPNQNLDMLCGSVYGNDGKWHSYYCYEHVPRPFVCQVNNNATFDETTSSALTTTETTQRQTTTSPLMTTKTTAEMTTEEGASTSTSASTSASTSGSTSKTTSSTPSSSISSTSSTSSSTSGPSTTPESIETTQSPSGYDPGMIAGIVIGVVFGVTFLVVLGIVLYKKSTRPSELPFSVFRTESTRGLNPAYNPKPQDLEVQEATEETHA